MQLRQKDQSVRGRKILTQNAENKQTKKIIKLYKKEMSYGINNITMCLNEQKEVNEFQWEEV